MTDVRLRINARRIGKFENDNVAVSAKSNIFKVDQPVPPFILFSL